MPALSTVYPSLVLVPEYKGTAKGIAPCMTCHIDAGRLAESAPLWVAWVAYPAYRSKNKKVNTFIERIQV